MDRRETAGLDALRGLLAMIVCAGHAWQVFIFPAPNEGAMTAIGALAGLSAGLAVLWFFSLSGYVISISIRANTQRCGAFRLSEYALARFFRIVPPLLLVILFTLGIAWLLNLCGMDHTPISRSTRATYSVDLQSQLSCIVTLCIKGWLPGYINGPLWSLALEIHLYVLTGLGAFVAFGTSAYLRTLAGIALMLFCVLLYKNTPHNMGPEQQSVCYLAFFGGAFASLCPPNNKVALASAFAGLVLLATVLLTIGPINVSADQYGSGAVIAGQLGFVLAATAALPSIGRVKTVLDRTGQFSYTLYIFHFPLLFAIFFAVSNWMDGYSRLQGWLLAFACFPLVVFVCALVSRYIERPYRQRTVTLKMLRIASGNLP